MLTSMHARMDYVRVRKIAVGQEPQRRSCFLSTACSCEQAGRELMFCGNWALIEADTEVDE